jgi:DNA-directed RNA polymerase specialized sigma24 family protein
LLIFRREPLPPASGERWSLTQQALDRLLQRLDQRPEAAAREYEFLRRRLITFFSLRSVDSPDRLADEAMDRVARRLEEGETIDNVRAYFHGVAQRIASESAKRQTRERAALDGYRPFLVTDEASEEIDARADCLERCLECLPRETRALIRSYYQNGPLPVREGRKLLAQEQGLSDSGLRVRAHRIRTQLEQCLVRCLEARKSGRS